MSRGFESLADSLIAKGTHPDTIYTKLAEHMDKNGVPMFSFRRYADRPEIVRLFNERGTHATAPDKSAVLAPLLRAAYKPGETPLDGALPGQATNDMLAEALVERDRLASFARWLISMDAMDTEAGWTLRKTVSLNDIIARAHMALGPECGQSEVPPMEPVPEYVYLVSYAFNNGLNGFGASEIRATAPLNSWAEVRKLKTAIAEPVAGRVPLDANAIVILNWILLSGPKAA